MRNGLKGKEIYNEKNNVRNNNSNIIIKDKIKFFTCIGIILVVFVVVICIISFNSGIEINENTNLSELNVSKYGEEIKEQYEQEGKNSKFIEDWENIQDSVAMYFIENYTTDTAQVILLVDNINEILKSDNWDTFNVAKPTMWNGSWQSDEKGKVTFKFAVKEIEPSWATTLSEQGYITLN